MYFNQYIQLHVHIAFLRMCKDVLFLFLASRVNPKIKVLEYINEWQALSSGKLSLIDASLLPIFGQNFSHL
jgi:hypothetical protein